MKDIAEFQKLFKVNFPVTEHSQYYIDTLMRSPFYAGLGNVVKEYEQYEREVIEMGYKSAKSYKLDYALPRLKNFILNSEPYKNLMDWEMPDKLRTKDELRNNDNTYLISIDFKSANYNALKTFDSFGALSDSWEDFCRILDIHPTLSKSKSFRQYVFGNTSPKRLTRRQHDNTIKIVNALIDGYDFEEEDFVFISHDELIVRLRPDHKHAVNRINLLLSAVGMIIKEKSIDMPTHYKVFKNEGIGAGMCVQTQYNVKMGGLSEKHDTLFKVPGNKFFKYFKTHILKEPLDRRDLMFMSDGEIAIWSTEDDSIAERLTPEGEMNMEEVKENYPHLFKSLKKEVAGMSDLQVRKAINIFINRKPVSVEVKTDSNKDKKTMDTCPHCNKPVGYLNHKGHLYMNCIRDDE